MTATAARAGAPPGGIAALLERFDPDVIELPPAGARIRLEVRGEGAWDAILRRHRARLERAGSGEPDALLTADRHTWARIASDLRGGMDAFRRGRLRVRRSLHHGVGFLAATSGADEPGRLRFGSVRSPAGRLSLLEAGTGEPIVCLHGLGGTKASFLPTVAALADGYRVIALDLPGFGESDKPVAAAYDAPWFARAVSGAIEELGVGCAHVAGNSMGGRIAIELGLIDPARVDRLVMLSPAMAWLRDRRWATLLRLVRPELGLLQPTPRPIVEAIVRRLIPGAENGWVAAGVDEFLRAYLSPRGRAAFYAAARSIYLDEPHGERGFWTRLESLSPRALFVWGRADMLVPIAFMRHVERALPAARHVELPCGHVPQLECPRETHAAIRRFLSGA